MKPNLLVIAALLASAATAHADARADFRAGTALAVGSARVNLGNGPRSSTGSPLLRKAAGSLDLTLAAADLGVALPITLHLRGTVLQGGHIEFTIADTYTTPVNLGGGQTLSQVTGRLRMRASPLPGLAPQDVGNVRLRLVEPGRLVATGTWGSVAIAVEQLELLGGVPQPPLAGFRDPSRTTVCSDRGRTTRLLEVSLTGAARATGAAVSLASGDRAAVQLPSHIVVRPGQRTALVTAHISAGFVGAVDLRASAGGVSTPITLTVRPRSSCTSR